MLITVTIRNIEPLLDFEGRKELAKTDEKLEYKLHRFVTLQTFCIFMCVFTFNIRVKRDIIRLANSLVVLSFVSYSFVMLTSPEEINIISSLFFLRFIFIMLWLTCGIYYLQLLLISERKEQMSHFNDMNSMRKEYHAILENMSEVVITKTSDNCLKYSNSLGINILK